MTECSQKYDTTHRKNGRSSKKKNVSTQHVPKRKKRKGTETKSLAEVIESLDTPYLFPKRNERRRFYDDDVAEKIFNSSISSLESGREKFIVSPSSKSAQTSKAGGLSICTVASSSFSPSPPPTHIKLKSNINVEVLDQNCLPDSIERKNNNNHGNQSSFKEETRKGEETPFVPNKYKNIERTVIEYGDNKGGTDEKTHSMGINLNIIEEIKVAKEKEIKNDKATLNADKNAKTTMHFHKEPSIDEGMEKSPYDKVKERRKTDKNTFTCPVCQRTFSRLVSGFVLEMLLLLSASFHGCLPKPSILTCCL